MDTKKTFFSYSRTDSAFTLQLAKDLREAGEPIWLDQLDIQAGSRWDASIEAALEAAGRLIVVLSPESVASVNVMDEVAYALENNIIIIPVLLAECKTPFRISRLQRIDFSGEYQDGLNNLLRALKLSPGTTAADTPASVAQGTKGLLPKKAPGVAPNQKTASTARNPEVQGKKGNKKYLIIGGITLLLVLLIWGMLPSDSDGLGIGDQYQGGVVFYVDDTGEHGLAAGREDLGDFDYEDAITTCVGYEAGGYSDWYLPDRIELQKLYHQRDEVGGFMGIDYWSSTEDENDTSMGYGYRFDTGQTTFGPKTEFGTVRPIRKF